MGSYDLVSIIGLMVVGHIYDRIRSPRRTIIILGAISILFLFLLSKPSVFTLLIIVTLTLGFFVKSPTSLLDALYGQTIRNPGESYGKIRLSGSLGFMLTALLIQFTQWIKGSQPGTVFIGYAICMGITMISILLLPTENLITTEKHHEKISLISSLKSFPAIFWVGLIIAFLSSLSMSGHYTFFALLMKNKFHTENVSGFWALSAVFEIPLFFFSGYLLKKFKLRTLWIVCLVAGITRMQVYWISQSLLPLYLVQIVHCLSFGLNHMCMINLISTSTKPERRGLAMSLYTAFGMGLSMFTGGILGGFILKYGDFPLLFQVFSVFPLIAIIVAVVFLKEKTYPK